MPAYYNEFDAKKAAWLRELISRGLIAPGEVDERSIVDVRPDDLRGFTQCHFFAGIGIWSHALRLAGWPDEREVWTGSCPCQPFSAAGKGEAFDDERHLWPKWFPLIEARRPVVCFGEQVASIDGLAWLDLVQSDLDDADYTCGAVDLCAAGVGAPHRRQRLYWVADAEHAERWPEQQEHGNTYGGNGPGRRGDSRGMGDTGILADNQSNRRRKGATDGSRFSGRDSTEGSLGRTAEYFATRGVEDALRAERWPDQRKHGGSREASGRDESADRVGEQSKTEWLDDASANGRKHGDRCPVNGFWRRADWVLTRPQRVGDRPGLRPVERSSFPLAHGTPARVGRLRGYGDGIVVQAAKGFIEAYRSITE